MEEKKELYLTDPDEWTRRKNADRTSEYMKAKRRNRLHEYYQNRQRVSIDDQLKDAQAHKLNVMTSKLIGTRIKVKAKEKGVSTRQLAIELGIRHSNIICKLNASNMNLTVPEYFYLCERLEIDPTKCYKNMREAAKRKMEGSKNAVQE